MSTESLENNILQASTSKNINSPVSPADIIPLPKISLKRKRRINIKKSEILSSSLCKTQIETLEKDKTNAKLISEKNKADRQARRNLFETKSKSWKKNVPKKADTSEQVSTTVNAKSATTVTYKENCPASNEKCEDPPTKNWIMCYKC